MSQLGFANLLLRDAAALVIVKATVVLALASAAAVAAKGLSAARRHMLWLVALSSCVWLVLSSPVVPAIMIHTPMLTQTVATIAVPPIAAPPASARSATVANASRVSERFPPAETVRRSTLQSIPLPSHPFIALWIIGCVTLLVRHAIGFVGATRLARHASIANDDETTRELASVAAAAGVRREVCLGYSTDVQTPITFDVATSYVLLPTDATSWSSERRRAVLVHETAHIARGDWRSQAIGQLACDLFWFHPLVWRAFTRLRDEAERAADDCVLRSGMPALEYATHLLALARRTSNGRPDLVAIGIVSTNHLERRFVAMFDAKRSRTTVTSRARAITTSFALAMVCPLASLQVAPPAPLLHVAAQHVAPLQHAATSITPKSANAATIISDTARVSHTASGRAADARPVDLQPPTLETPKPPIAAAADSTPSAIAHPTFSGKWTQDTVTGPTVESSVTDSTIITQSANTISFDSRGHVQGTPTYSRVPSVSFDGTQSTGVIGTGSAGTKLAASAVWVADTLVLTTYAVVYVPGAIRDFLTYERMTLSPDGSTLLITNRSFVDGQSRWGGPRTFVLRRIAP